MKKVASGVAVCMSGLRRGRARDVACNPGQHTGFTLTGSIGKFYLL